MACTAEPIEFSYCSDKPPSTTCHGGRNNNKPTALIIKRKKEIDTYYSQRDRRPFHGMEEIEI